MGRLGYAVQKKPGQHLFTFPNYIQIEAHRGCTRQCDFCGIRFEDKPLSMSKEIYKEVLSQTDDRVKRFSYSLHGEPLLNEDLPWMMSETRKKIVKAQLAIVSNVDVLTRKHKSLDFLFELFDNGLNMIHVDLYDLKSKELFIDLVKCNKEKLAKKEIQVKNYYTAEETIWAYHGAKNKAILICDETKGFNSANSATRCFHTWAGNFPLSKFEKYGVDINEYPVMKQCTEPLRYMSVCANGDYLICCSEGSKITNLGNIMTLPLQELWVSEKLQKYRYALKQGWRDIIPACLLCNKRSFRVGLYPYWGQYEYKKEELKKFFNASEQLKDPGKNYKENIDALSKSKEQ